MLRPARARDLRETPRRSSLSFVAGRSSLHCRSGGSGQCCRSRSRARNACGAWRPRRAHTTNVSGIDPPPCRRGHIFVKTAFRLPRRVTTLTWINAHGRRRHAVTRVQKVEKRRAGRRVTAGRVVPMAAPHVRLPICIDGNCVLRRLALRLCGAIGDESSRG